MLYYLNIISSSSVLMNQYKNDFLDKTKEKGIDYFFNKIIKIPDNQLRTKISNHVISYFVQFRQSNEVTQLTNFYSSITIYDNQNAESYSKYAILFAENGYPKEALKITDAIKVESIREKTYQNLIYQFIKDCKFEEAIQLTFSIKTKVLKQETYSTIIYHLIEQKMFEEAKRLLPFAEEHLFYTFEKSILIGLGQQAEVNSFLNKRYWISNPIREITIEELTLHKIEEYARLRAQENSHCLDVIQCNFGKNSEQILSQIECEETEIQNALVEKYINEFKTLNKNKQCDLFQAYLMDKSSQLKELEEEELFDVLYYLRKI